MELKLNSNIILLIIGIILIIYLTYFYSENNRIKNKLTYLNDNLNYNSLRNTYDYCGGQNIIGNKVNIYKHKKLCDYYISSSYNSCLIGNQVFDYCSLEMIKKVLYFGARYIEIPIYDKDIVEDTIPIVYNSINNTKVTLNSLTFEEVIETIQKFAFNKRFIDNYNDPLFLFLNIKTKNIKTLDKVHDIFKKYMLNYLLSKQFNHINISKRTLCDLMGKCVILTNDSYINSKLTTIINCSTDKPYLNRITYNEALLNNSDLMGPKFRLSSNKVRFIETPIFKDYLEIDDIIDLTSYGIKKGDGIFISGSKNPKNNSGEFMFTINTISKTKIILDKNIDLGDSPVGDLITMEIYDKDLIKNNKKKEMVLLEEYNKDNLTIVIPDSTFFSNNQNYKDIHYRGCQFVCMNFQNIDEYLKDYVTYFKNKSFEFKQKVLINSYDIPNQKSLNSRVPAFNPDIILDIDYSFIDKLKNNLLLTIKPFNNSKLRLINNNRNSKFSLDYSRENSKFTIESGLNTNSGYISIKSGERYLTYSDCSCYLYFTKKPKSNDKDIMYKFNNYASFLALKPVVTKKNYNSFGVIKTEDDKDKLYYLKIRSNFNISNKLFVKNVREYEVKTFLYGNSKDNTRDVVVLKPKFKPNGDFFPVGDIVVTLDMVDVLYIKEDFQTEKALKSVPVVKSFQNFTTPIFSGAVDKPYDYELIWDNKEFRENFDDDLSIWMPKANSGFEAVGCVFVNGYNKPSINEVVCVSIDYLKESVIYSENANDLENDNYGEPVFYNTKYDLTLWNIAEHNYVKPNNIVTLNVDSKVIIPNSIEFKMYNFITEEKDFYDRLYLDLDTSTKNEKLSTLFNVEFDSVVSSEGNEIYDYLMKLENSNGKLISYTKDETGQKMCMGLPQPYWSSFYESVTNNNVVEEYDKKPKIKFTSCKSRDYFGTNWNLYSDNSIRLEGNPKACLTYNGNPENNISIDVNDSNNYLYLENCNSELKNQTYEFNNNNVKVNTKTNYDPNACLTHGPNNELRLEECGDKKFTVISKWNNKIARVDKCNRIDAEEELKNINAIEECVDNSYYVVYLDNGFNHTHKEFCSLESANIDYENNINKYRRGVGLISQGKILKHSSKNDGKSILKKYIFKLNNTKGDCLECKQPSKILCVENSIQDSKYTSFQNDSDKKDISNYCRTLKNDNSFKCSRKYRQKFNNNINPNNFCVNYFKEVYVYLHSNPNYLNINVSRPQYNNSEALIDNLLGENYDSNNYHMFVKGIVSKSTDDDKFKIVFDTSVINGINNNSIELYKFSNDIILNYSPNYENVKIGTKVLAQLGIQEPKDLLDKTNIDFIYESSKINYKDINGIKISGSAIKWMGVIIKKLKNNKVEVMFSINSYNTSNSNNLDDLRPYSDSNIVKIFNISDVVLLRKAPLCI